jgi:ABC-type branched-subunit amino acid transport system substrate-binding protein
MKNIKISIGVFVLLLIIVFILINSKSNINDIKVGVVLPLTGGASLVGEDYKAGMEFAAEEFGINIEFQDGKAIPTDSLSAAMQLVNTGSNVIFTAFRGASLAVASNFKDKEGVVVFATTATSDTKPIGEYGDNFFAIGAEMVANGAILGKYAVNTCQNAVVLTEKSDGGKDKVMGFSQAFGQDKILLSEEFANDKSEFRDLVTKVKSYNPDCIFVEIKSNYFKSFMDQVTDFGLASKIFTTSYTINKGVASELTEKQKNSIIFSSTAIYPSNKIQEQYFSKYGKPFTDFSLAGYEMIRLVYENQKGCPEENITDCLAENLKKISNKDSFLGKLTVDSNQEIKLRDNVLYRINGTEFEVIR